MPRSFSQEIQPFPCLEPAAGAAPRAVQLPSAFPVSSPLCSKPCWALLIKAKRGQPLVSGPDCRALSAGPSARSVLGEHSRALCEHLPVKCLTLLVEHRELGLHKSATEGKKHERGSGCEEVPSGFIDQNGGNSRTKKPPSPSRHQLIKENHQPID